MPELARGNRATESSSTSGIRPLLAAFLGSASSAVSGTPRSHADTTSRRGRTSEARRARDVSHERDGEARHLRAQVEALIADQLWDSAALLGGFLASANPSDPTSPGERATASRWPRTHCSAGRHRRAMHFYRQALQLNRLAPVPVVSAAVATPGASSRSTPRPAPRARPSPPRAAGDPAASTPEPRAHPHVDEATLKYKLGRCHVALREWRALAEFETIPARADILSSPSPTPPPHGIRTSRGGVLSVCADPHVIEALVALAGSAWTPRKFARFSPRRRAAAAAGYRVVGNAATENGGRRLRRTTPSGTGIGTSAGTTRRSRPRWSLERRRRGGRPGDADTAANATRWMWHFAEGHASLAGAARPPSRISPPRSILRIRTTSCYPSRVRRRFTSARSSETTVRAVSRRRPHALDSMDGYAELLYTRFAGDDRTTGGGILSHAAARPPRGGFGVLSTGFGFRGDGSVGGWRV